MAMLQYFEAERRWADRIILAIQKGAPKGLHSFRWTGLFFFLLVFTVPMSGQFSASLQGNVTDPTGAAVAGANIQLVNVDTHETKSVNANDAGVYQIPSLAPGNYNVTARHAGFEGAAVTFSLNAAENRNVALVLKVGAEQTNITVTSQAPILDTADSRNELTLTEEAVQDLPLPGRNATILTLLAPGVTGRGPGYASTGNGGGSGNFGAENNDISANGGGTNGNQYILDGLDVNISVNAGVTGLVPNPDSLSQITVQTNTYSSEYGKTAAIQTVFTSKGGTDRFHGFASEYYQYQGLNAKGEFFPAKTKLSPYHTNNLSFGIGGPIIPHHQFFGFFAIEPFHATTSNGQSTTQIEDPAFVAFAQTARPNSPEVQLFKTLAPSGAQNLGASATAQSLFGPTNAALGTGCATPSTDNVPCSLPVTDNAVFNSSNYVRAQQWNVRVDKNFGEKDRLYGTYFKIKNDTGGPAIRPVQATGNQTRNYFYQINETHTFTPSTLNEGSVGVGNLSTTADIPANNDAYKFPAVNVSGLPQGFGAGFIDFNFSETNYHWRDVLTHIVGSHTLRFGYEWYRGSDIANAGPTRSQPTLTYNSLIDFINDAPYSETGLAYNPLTGQPQNGSYQYAVITQGAFAEDTWKVNKRLTVNYGLRYDNEGNAFPVGDQTVLANFHLASSGTFQQQVTNGVITKQNNTFDHDLNPVFSPRGGFAYDLFGEGKSVLRGGFGLFRDWVTLGQQENQLSSNPPAFVIPNFRNDGSTVGKPAFGFGTRNSFPLGFPYPQLNAGALDSHGGLVGNNLSVGGVDGKLAAPYTLSYSLTVEQQVTPQMVASLGWVGSHGGQLQRGFAATFANAAAPDVNVFAGDLLQHLTCNHPTGAATCTGRQTRLNPSFGSINYGYNGPTSNYNGLIAAVKGRFAHRGFITASYTWSHSNDSTTNFPVELPLRRWYGPSAFDVRNAFSAGFNYNLPDVLKDRGIGGRVLSGWNVASNVFLQSGTPFTVYTGAPLLVSRDANGNLSYDPKSGDFIADGDNNLSVPNVSSAHIGHSRSDYRNGVFPGCTGGNLQCGPFSVPQYQGTSGTIGNEGVNTFRNPGYAETDATLRKVTALVEGVNLELRIDYFNLFNRVNLGGVVNNAQSSSFGTVQGLASIPRQGQLGAKVTF